jgi:hypothetical protein
MTFCYRHSRWRFARQRITRHQGVLTQAEEEQEAYRLEADHRSTSSIAQGRQRKTAVVCAALENRGPAYPHRADENQKWP